VINTVRGHQKELNLARDGRVAICVLDPAQSGRYLQVRGKVVRTTEGEEALAHIHKLSNKYSGRDYRLREGEQRVKVTIAPLHVTYRGGGGGSGRWGGISS
jgi:hypothetical protein